MRLDKEQAEALKETMRAASNEAPMMALGTLLMHELDRVKDELVIAAGGTIPTLQGEALAYMRILKFLKERPVTPQKV